MCITPTGTHDCSRKACRTGGLHLLPCRLERTFHALIVRTSQETARYMPVRADDDQCKHPQRMLAQKLPKPNASRDTDVRLTPFVKISRFGMHHVIFSRLFYFSVLFVRGRLISSLPPRSPFCFSGYWTAVSCSLCRCRSWRKRANKRAVSHICRHRRLPSQLRSVGVTELRGPRRI